MLLLLLIGAGGGAPPVVVLYSTAPNNVVPDDTRTDVVPDDWSADAIPDDYRTDVSPDSESILAMKNGATNTLSGTLTMADESLYPSWVGATGEIAIKSAETGALLLDYTALDSLNVTTKRYSFTPTGVDFTLGEVVYDFRVTFPSVSPNVVAFFPSFRDVPADVMDPVGTP